MKIAKTVTLFVLIFGLYACQDSVVEPVPEHELSFIKSKSEAITTESTTDGIKFLKNGRVVRKDSF